MTKVDKTPGPGTATVTDAKGSTFTIHCEPGDFTFNSPPGPLVGTGSGVRFQAIDPAIVTRITWDQPPDTVLLEWLGKHRVCAQIRWDYTCTSGPLDREQRAKDIEAAVQKDADWAKVQLLRAMGL